MNSFLGLTVPTPKNIILSVIIFGVACAPYDLAIGQQSVSSTPPVEAWNDTARSLPETEAEHVIVFALEGISNGSIQGGTMPVLNRMSREGAVTWSATSITPALTVPAMASLVTGLPVEKHRITQEWETYDFSRAFLRAPTVFDYMDLAAGRDTAIFWMDERFYQLARPEIYIDTQICSQSKPNCQPETMVEYIHDYLRKVTSERGHGFRLFTVPHLLLVHFPTAARAGLKNGWDSQAYQQAKENVDTAIGRILSLYHHFGVLSSTMVIITGLNGGQPESTEGLPFTTSTYHHSQTVPFLAWGANIKSGHTIQSPVSILDTSATILRALGLETHTEWDSHAIEEIFQNQPTRRTTNNESDIQKTAIR